MRLFSRFTPFTRLARSALAGFALAAVALVLFAAPASAHATLESTTPEQGSEVTSAPSSVSLRFSEAVGIGARAVEVLDGAGRRVDDGAPRHPDGNGAVVEVAIPGSLPQGSYTVVWRVVSADSHPIAGTFSFGVQVRAGAAPISATDDPAVAAVDAVLRGGAYVGAVLLVGGAFFLVVLWPAGFALRRCRRLLVLGWAASTAAAAGLFVLQGPYGAGVGLSSALDPQLLGDTLATRYGKLMLLRLVVLAFAVPALRRAAASGQVRSNVDLAGLGAVFLLSFSLAEHSGQGTWWPLPRPPTPSTSGRRACGWVAWPSWPPAFWAREQAGKAAPPRPGRLRLCASCLRGHGRP